MSDENKTGLKEVNLDDLRKEVTDNVEKNLRNTDQEANLFIKPGKDVKGTEAPMQLNGKPDLSPPHNEKTSLTIKKEKANWNTEDGDRYETYELEMSRLRVSDRENIALFLLQMFQSLNLIDEDGLNLKKLQKAEFEELVVIASYLRKIAPLCTDKDEEFFENVPFSEMTKFMDWLLTNEVGLLRTVEDFFSTASPSTSQKK